MLSVFLILFIGLQLSQSPPFEKYETASGLSNNIVYDVFQDSEGFIWIATENGLNKFDGYEFEIFRNDPNDSTSISANIVRSIVEDKDNNLWVGTYNGLNKFDRKTKTFKRITEIPGGDGTKLDTQSLMVDTNGDIWFVHVNFVFRYKPATNEFKEFFIRSGIGRLFLGPEDQVMVQTFNGDSRSLFIIKNDDTIIEHTISAENGSDFMYVSDRTGYVWVSNEEERTLFSKTRLLPKLPGRTITHVLEDTTGNVWIGSDNGLFVYEEGSVVEIPLNIDSNQLSKTVRVLFQDRWGGIWVGTLGGLYHFDPFQKAFSHIDIQGGPVMSLYSNNEELWIGSLSEGLFSYSLSNKELRSFSGLSGLDVRQVWEVYKEKESSFFWLGTDQGLIKVNSQTNQARKIELALSVVGDPVIFSVINADENSLWVAGDEAVYRVNKSSGNTVEEIDFRVFPNLSTVQSLYLINQETLLIGTEGLGLFIYDTTQKELVSFEDAETIADAPVWDIYKDAKDHIWLGTGSGVFQVNPQLRKATHYPGPDAIIYSILEDEFSQKLWLGTDRGLASFDIESGRSTFFGDNDGLENTEFNRRSAYKSESGIFYFGGTKGITHFKPADIKQNPNPPIVHITQSAVISDTGTTLMTGNTESLNLTWSKNTLEFDFVALNYTNTEQNRYKYRLKNYDPEWIESATKRSVRYTKLPPGEYVFEVQATNNDGVWSATSATLQITISPPFWKTWWAYMIYITTAFGSVWMFMIYRTRSLESDREKLEKVVSERTNELIEQKEVALQAKKMIEEQAHRLEELDEMKSRFFANISHELRTPLTLIQAPVKEMLDEWSWQAHPEKAQSQLKLIERNSERLKKLIEELLDLSRLKQETLLVDKSAIDLNTWLPLFIEPYQSLARLKEIRLKVEHDLVSQSNLLLDINKFEKIVSNLVTNALKFTPNEGQITMRVSFAETFLSVKVNDTGSGISEAEQHKIFDRFYQSSDTKGQSEEGLGLGLALSKELAELMGGSLSVNSKIDEGSTFLLEIPTEEVQKTPVEVNDDKELGKEQSQEVERQEPSLSVLIVEDNPEMRNYIHELLDPHIKTYVAENGQEALNKLEGISPNLVLSDVMMPVMDGFTLSRSLKKHSDYAQIPILMLTARSSDEDKIEGFRAGVDDYLVKPFIPMVLKARALNLARNHYNRMEWVKKIIQENEDEIPDTSELGVIQNVITNQLQNVDLNVNVIAKELHISLRQAYRKIQALTGMTPIEYINSLRLSKARELLQSSSNLTIDGIASEVGFKSRSYFSKLFKQHYGVSPSEYAKNN